MATPRKILLVVCFALVAASSPAFAQRWGQGNFPREGACFYKDPNFRGDYFCVGSGDDFGAVPEGMNDRISSLRLFGRVEVTVFKDVRFAGRSERFESDIRNLKDEGWNDLISSIRVRRESGGGGNGRPGGRPAFGRPTEDPDRVIRRAYEDLLNRQPDPTGLRIYRSHMLDDGWSEAQVREALRNSPEYREKSTMTYAKAEDIVRRAYLAVLRREPDPASRPFVDKVFREHWSQQDVERELRKSAEYRNKGH
jgi:hypothetical protein